MSTAIGIGSSTLVLPIPAENYDLNIINANNTAIANEVNAIGTKYAKGIIAQTVSAGPNNGNTTAIVMDIVVVNLVLNRWYKVTYRPDVTCSASANMAIGVNCKKSATSDSTTAGTDVDNAVTISTSPVANQGQTFPIEYTFKASATETVNIKMVMARLTTASTFDVGGRKLTVIDLGAQF